MVGLTAAIRDSRGIRARRYSSGEHTVEVLAQLANEADIRGERPVDP
jgi:hypothetical protein